MRRCSRGLRAALVSTTLLHRWTSSRHLQVKSPPFQLRPPSPATAVMRTTDNPNCCASDGSPCRDFPATFLQFFIYISGVKFRGAALKVDKRGRTQQLGVFNRESGFLLSLVCFISKKHFFFLVHVRICTIHTLIKQQISALSFITSSLSQTLQRK